MRVRHLEHEVVLIHNTIVGEATHGGDVLVGDIKLGGRLVAVGTLLANLVHLWKEQSN